MGSPRAAHFRLSKNLVEFAPAGANKMSICFVRWREHRTKHKTPGKCGICAQCAHKLCAQAGEAFSNAEKTEFLIKKNSSNSEESEELVREAGLEPARPEWTLEPESSESANSTTRAFAVFQLLGYITTDIPACQAEGAEKLRKTYRRIAGMTGRRRGVLKIMQIPAITAQRGI